MELSSVIFVALAVVWALYLIPKALSHHDEIAKTRSVDSFSDSVRVLGRKVAAPEASAAADAPVTPVVATLPISRAAARRAAKRRRRVLYVLLFATAVLAGLTYFAYVPRWSAAVPVGVLVIFLVTARRTVRRQRGAIIAAPAESDTEDTGTIDLALEEQVAEVVMPVEDEGSLWDPLPVTLPTYVTKARARRTVRTIELTQLTSSGHDAADSALVAEAEAAEVADATLETEADERKAAGA